MQIFNNNNNTTFTGFKFQTSKMNQVQSRLSDRIAAVLCYSDEFTKASDMGVDICFLKGQNDKAVKIAFMDIDSDQFYRDGKKIVNNIGECNRSSFKIADEVIENLKKIINGTFKQPEQNIEKIANAKTDLAKLRPNIYKEMLKDSEDLKNLTGDDIMKKEIALEHIAIERKLRRDDNF